MSGGGKAVDNARTERKLRTDDREIDLFTVGEGQQTVEVGHLDRPGLRQPRDARIPRDAQQRAGVSVARKPRDERMLARAASDDENPHGVNDLGEKLRPHLTQRDRDYFVDLDWFYA